MDMLSEVRILKLRELMRKVNVSEICGEIGVKRRVIYAVLDGESPRINDLEQFEKAAKKDVARRRKQKLTKRKYNRSL